MSDQIIVKQFELSEKAALLDFLKVAFHDNPKMYDEKFWDWHFPENPYVEKNNIPIWIAKDGEKIVGQLAAIPIEIKVGAETKRAMWILDLIVLPEYRRHGLGKRVTLEAEKFCTLGLGINTAAQHSTALLEKIGWTMLTKIPRYSKLLYPGEAVREITKIKPMRSLANSLFAPARSDKKNYFAADSKIKFVENFDISFDELWNEASKQFDCAVVRSSKILDWQYCRQPGKKFDVLGYYENGKLLGYAVMYFRKINAHGAIAKAAITDICYHPEKPVEIIDELISASLQLAIERRAGSVVTDVLNPLIEARLQKSGFWKTKNPLQFLIKSEIKKDLMYQSENWFLTRGDSDTSIFEHPNL